MSVIVSGNEIVLNGCVGDPSGWGFEDCFTSSDVIMALARVGNTNDVIVRINSGGGIATEGSAIHSALARHAGRKTVVVEGIAASAASVIAMAGDTVQMSLGALMMIHDPSGFTMGTITDHEMQIAALTALGDAMSTIYAAKSGQTAEQCRADMRAETWMTADQAIAKGYADAALGPAADEPNDDVEVIDPAPFNYALYARAPATMVAMAKAKHWTKQPAQRAEAPPATPPAPADEATPGENEPMTQEELNAKLAEARAAGAAEATRTHEAAARTALSPALAADIAKLCNEGGVPTMTASLLTEAGITLEKATARVKAAGDIKEHVALAHRQNPAAVPLTLTAEFVAQGLTPGEAKGILFDKLAAATDARPLATQHRAGAGGADHGANTNERDRSKANMEATLKKQGLLPKKEG